MLRRVINEIEQVHGVITLKELSRTLNIEPGALSGMIDYLVQKGHIKDDDKPVANSADACLSPTCGISCTGVVACPFIAKMPKTYSLPAPVSDYDFSKALSGKNSPRTDRKEHG
jgi:hypothetical protein